MPKRCTSCGEIYSEGRVSCPSCQERAALVVHDAPVARLPEGRRICVYALLLQGGLLLPLGPLMAFAFLCWMFAALVHFGGSGASLWLYLAALGGGSTCAILLWMHGWSPALALLLCFTGLISWLVGEDRVAALRFLLAVLALYYITFAIMLVARFQH